MIFMKWSSKYEVGIPEMDAQHKHWIELLNAFCEGLEEQAMKLHLINLLYETINYTLYHFSEEERLMQNIGYPSLNDQKKLHTELYRTIESLRDKIARDEPVVPKTVTKELKNWFNYHLLIEDKKYVELYNRIKT
ncbi:MAG: hemerythrin family protein [Treponema sp.]|nr:hemerythrin family protein [Treponema sp.]